MRLGIVCDYPEEGWASMDLAAEMLLQAVQAQHAHEVRAERTCPSYRRRLSRVPWLGRTGLARNGDRLLNRLWDYPRYLRSRSTNYDVFHLCDHSYSQLVHVLPPEQTGVFCHDLDTFRCLFEPQREPRPRWFRAMARHVLRGMQKAAVVFYATRAVAQQIERLGQIDPARLVHAPNGVCPEFTPYGEGISPKSAVSREVRAHPYLLHVGSCISRKRIDVLLDVFAAVHSLRPELRLLQVGGEWTPAQREQIDRLGISEALRQVRGLTRAQVADCYRGAAVVLQPSEAEGFGLPVVEALACGAIVVASDLPVLREVGGDAVVYRPVADVPAWAAVVEQLLGQSADVPRREVRLAWASRYTWDAQARTILSAYRAVCSRSLAEPASRMGKQLSGAPTCASST